MSKLPTKQIYLLLIIIVGIIALSVYSTYSIFTLESETSNVLSIHTPSSLEVSTDMYEYKQLTVPKNQVITTDIDIYNTYDYEICYSVWYKISTSLADSSKVKIYQNTDLSNTTSSTIESVGSRRISLIITNDNDMDVSVNIGITSHKNEGTCELNISSDKLSINTTLSQFKKLTDVIVENSGKVITQNEGYLIYKNETDIIDLEEENVLIASSFNYKDEVFTLNNPQTIELGDIKKYQSNDTIKYYTCLGGDNCLTLYQINLVNLSDNKYQLTDYDRYSGYQAGTSGIKQVTQNTSNYVYYGDNPNNFIYFNCKNETDTKTCELWRIIGVVLDDDDNYITKIIRDRTIGLFEYSKNNNNLWQNATLNEYLNSEYKVYNDEYLNKMNYQQENIIDLSVSLNKITMIDVTKKSMFGLMSLSDYLLSSTCQDGLVSEYKGKCLNDNWLNNNKNEWTMSINYSQNKYDETTNELVSSQNNTVYSVGSGIEEIEMTTSLNVRPVAYLKSRMLVVDGDGTINNPYIIK